MSVIRADTAKTTAINTSAAISLFFIICRFGSKSAPPKRRKNGTLCLIPKYTDTYTLEIQTNTLTVRINIRIVCCKVNQSPRHLQLPSPRLPPTFPISQPRALTLLYAGFLQRNRILGMIRLLSKAIIIFA